MVELGQLEAHAQEFKKRNVQVVAISMESQEEARKTQAEFPHLVVVADNQRGLVEAIAVVHEKAAPDGSDSAAPTTILVDGGGIVRWVFRPGRVFDRLEPDDVLAAIDKHS